MPIAVVHSRTLTIGTALPVTVEVHLANGLPGCAIVGLPDTEVRESRERVRAALHHCGFTFPPRRITVNLAPADVPKASGGFDLPIALGILVASGQLPENVLRDAVFVGELSLNGELREIRGAFALGCSTVGDAALSLYLPRGNALEAAYVPGSCVYGASDLPGLCAHLRGEQRARITRTTAPAHAACSASEDACTPPPGAHAARGDRDAEDDVADGMADGDIARDPNGLPDLADVIGQAAARRALEVAAAGGHHMLMVGPPGAGKSIGRPPAWNPAADVRCRGALLGIAPE